MLCPRRQLPLPVITVSVRMKRQAYTSLGNPEVTVHLGKDWRLTGYDGDLRSLPLKNAERPSIWQLHETYLKRRFRLLHTVPYRKE